MCSCLPGPGECLLDQVLRLSTLAAKPPRQAIEVAAVGAHHAFESRLLVVGHELDLPPSIAKDQASCRFLTTPRKIFRARWSTKQRGGGVRATRTRTRRHERALWCEPRPRRDSAWRRLHVARVECNVTRVRSFHPGYAVARPRRQFLRAVARPSGG